MEKEKHVLIAGTGRTGTTFLVELLTNLGLDTGFTSESIKTRKSNLSRAGLEHSFKKSNCPYIVKDPWFFEYADDVLAREDIEIERVIIPIRNLNAAAESRRNVTSMGLIESSVIDRLLYHLGFKRQFAGGLSRTRSLKEDEQEQILSNQLYELMLSLANHDIPVTLIQFPKSVNDSGYLYNKLEPLLADVEYNQFHKIYEKTVQLKLVNSFNKNDC